MNLLRTTKIFSIFFCMIFLSRIKIFARARAIRRSDQSSLFPQSGIIVESVDEEFSWESVSDCPENQENEESSNSVTFKFPVDKILDKAEEYIDTFEYEMAQKFCQRALEMDADNIRALEISASLLIEIGDFENAKKCLGRAVHLCPDTGHNKYMSLGQLLDGHDSLNCYLKGIDLLVQERDKQSQQEVSLACKGVDNNDVNKELSTAYLAVAELYMTDCCDDENAEQKCKENIEKAIASEPENPEAYQCMANFYLVKDQQKEAKEILEKSLSLWLPKYQAIREGKLQADDFVEVCQISFPARIDAVKMLIELKEYDPAAEILEGLTEEDDEVVEVWYLLGWMNYLRGEDYKGNARFYLSKAKEVAAKVNSEDTALVEHVNELLEELGPCLDNEDDDDIADKENSLSGEEDFESSEEEMEQ